MSTINWFRTDRSWTWILTIKIFSSSTPSGTVRDLAAAQQLIHQMPASPQLLLNLLQLILNTIFKVSFVTNLFMIDDYIFDLYFQTWFSRPVRPAVIVSNDKRREIKRIQLILAMNVVELRRSDDSSLNIETDLALHLKLFWGFSDNMRALSRIWCHHSSIP